MQAKRFLPFLLAILVFVSNTGSVLSMHFCQGEAEKISFSHSDHKHCEAKTVAKKCCDEETESDDCCADVAIQDQLWDKQLPEKLKLNFAVLEDLIFHTATCSIVAESTNSPVLFQTQHFVESNAPPIYIQYHQLLVYS